MPRSKPPTPTDAELDILKIVWDAETVTVRFVHDVLSESKSVAMTTVATTIANMVDRGLLEVVDGRRPQQLRAAIDKAKAHSSLIQNLADRVFGGSIPKLFMSAVSGQGLTADERKKLADLLKEKEQER